MKPDRLAVHSAPINSTAARVLYGKGASWDVKRKPTEHETFEAPPLPEMQAPAESKDYTGFRRGYMTAFRFHGGEAGARTWLARCDCGRYEIRRIVRWVKKPDVADGCSVCRAEYFIKHGVTLGDTRTRQQREREIRIANGEAA